MLPNEILPAIPMQKVKYCTGEIGEVLCTYQSELVEFEDQPDDSVMVRNVKTGRNDCWQMEDCEPVTEEPRTPRIGDKVTLPSWGSNATRYGIITGIVSHQGYNAKTYYVDGDLLFDREEIRLASPQEIKDHFAS